MNGYARIARVSLAGPFHEPFDYRIGSDSVVEPGMRVSVPFGRRHRVGIVTSLAEHSAVPANRLRDVKEVLDSDPLLPGELLAFITWASRYYHHPLGDCLDAALPALLRRGGPARPVALRRWRPLPSARDADRDRLRRRAPRQAAVLQRLLSSGDCGSAQFHDFAGDWRGALDRLVAQGLVEAVEASAFNLLRGSGPAETPELNSEQSAAAQMIGNRGDERPLLLEGVTGSGKTEVYLDAIKAVLERDEQALVIVPEIGLTPQLLRRFSQRLGTGMAVLHSGLSEGERLGAWLAARSGEAGVVLGTRSAILAPLARPGLIVVDEEHDPSLKQQEGFRYSARDLAAVRARRLGVPLVLGSATPSLESLHNARSGRYRRARLEQRATGAPMPRFRLLDVRGRPMSNGLSEPLLALIRQHIEARGQVLVFLNRRGYAPTLLCHECGWVAGCARCDARLTYHRGRGRLHCHHCGYERGVDAHCPECGSADLRPLGLGTQRLEQTLTEMLPNTPALRVDRDSTRRRGEFARRMERARSGEARLLLGTQMLAKGHHLPEVTLVAIVDADQGLFGADFRAPERLAQMVIQVAGRAGRAARPGEVAIQTHHPEHPLLQTLIHEGYPAFSEAALAERLEAALPPARHLAMLRAEAVAREAPAQFLHAARALADRVDDNPRVERLGPVPAPMERRAGRYRAQLLLQADARRDLHRLLGRWVPALGGLAEARRVRWSLDVDPNELL